VPSVRRRALRVVAALAAVAAVVPLALGGAATATAATAPPADGAWFGPDLDWGSDGPDGYAGRLGETPSLYGVNIDYPLVFGAVVERKTSGVDRPGRRPPREPLWWSASSRRDLSPTSTPIRPSAPTS
jgi:hypothetical protein